MKKLYKIKKVKFKGKTENKILLCLETEYRYIHIFSLFLVSDVNSVNRKSDIKRGLKSTVLFRDGGVHFYRNSKFEIEQQIKEAKNKINELKLK